MKPYRNKSIQPHAWVLTVWAVGLASVGCQTETVLEDGTRITTRDTPDQRPAPTIKTNTDAPPELHEITGELMTFRTKFGFLPDELQSLVDAGLVKANRFPKLPEYAYQAQGLGMLNDGRIVVIVDHTIRINGFVWCVWTQPTAHNKPELYTVGLVPLRELEQAATG